MNVLAIVILVGVFVLIVALSMSSAQFEVNGWSGRIAFCEAKGGKMVLGDCFIGEEIYEIVGTCDRGRNCELKKLEELK